MNFYARSDSVEFDLFVQLDQEDFENISDSSFVVGGGMVDKPTAQ
jgi:hypothetical protein